MLLGFPLTLLLAAGAPPRTVDLAPCEISAAVRDGDVVTLADNEDDERLFRYRLVGAALVPDGTRSLGDDRDRPHDSEALARDGERLFVIGSLQGGRCDKPKRARLLVRQGDDRRAIDLAPVLDRASADACLALAHDGAAPFRAALCGALAPPACALNVEGAYVDADHRLWLGLRAPLVDGKALLLRMSPDLLSFDDARTLDLAGRGVRELVWHDGVLHVVAGPPTDADVSHVLFRVGADGVPKTRVTLPARTESVVFLADSRLLAITDGDGKRPPCREPSRVHVVDLPAGTAPPARAPR